MNSLDDAAKLQKTLEDLNIWQDTNNMEFTHTKFQLPQLGRGSELHTSYNNISPYGSEVILLENSIRDLSVIVSGSQPQVGLLYEVFMQTMSSHCWTNVAKSGLLQRVVFF